MSLLPDPADLVEQLGHVRDTRDHLDRIAAWLEDGIALLGPANPSDLADQKISAPTNGAGTTRELEPPAAPPEMPSEQEAEQDDEDAGSDPASSDEPKPEPPPSAPAKNTRTLVGAPPARAGARDHKAKILAAVISANTPLSKGQIAERLGLRKEQIHGPLQELVTSGKIIGEGATVKRRYAAAAVAPHSEAGARSAAGRQRNAAQLTDAVARIGLRERVLKVIAADPCRHDNNTLADELEAHADDIADACQHLVNDGKIEMHDDGTYLRTVRAMARIAAGLDE